MAEQVRAGGKKNRKLGRQAHHPSHVHYTQNHLREKHKLLRVLKSNGWNAALGYVDECAKRNIVVKLPAVQGGQIAKEKSST